ncbi:MATE family efflux transporter [Aliagarivorans taiwanensis]|uniref:MATE family efflux transporter n=1 Tax=Aliagarivorans taiwanensis TaxID=561966 RepID=UPI000428CF59|nr:MATE family efflux transporter [Aliagarivorans taiwanensis]
MSDTSPIQTSVARTFWRYAIPSVMAMLISGLYQIIDGIFVGQFIGMEGLAGINLAWPLICVIIGVGLLVGMGAGSLQSIARGEQDEGKARQILSTGLILSLLYSLACTLLLWLFGDSLLQVQGAAGDALAHAQSYIQVFIWAAGITVVSSALPLLVSNDDSPRISTSLIGLGAVLNILLDYLFIGVFDWGLRGAALATTAAQGVVCILGLGYFFSRYAKLRLKWNELRFVTDHAVKLTGLGTSNLLMYCYFGFIIALHNAMFMQVGDTVDVGAFAIVGYLATLYYLFSQGIANGLQPPVSYYFGAGQYPRISQTFNLALATIIVSGLAFTLVLNLFPEQAIGLFVDDDPQLLAASIPGIRIHILGLALDGFIFLASVYYMAVNKGRQATMISISNMLVQIPLLLLLPRVLGVAGVWMTVPLSNLLLGLVIAYFLLKEVRRFRQTPTKQSLHVSNAV